MRTEDTVALYSFLDHIQGGKALPDLMAHLPERQAKLVKMVEDAINDAGLEDAVRLINPGHKSQERATEVVCRRYAGHAARISDMIRVGIKIDSPEQAEELTAGLMEQGQQVCDTNWQMSARGVMLKFVYVSVPGPERRDRYVGEIIFRMNEKLPPDYNVSGTSLDKIIRVQRHIYEIRRRMEFGPRQDFKAPENENERSYIRQEVNHLLEEIKENLPKDFQLDTKRMASLRSPVLKEVFHALAEQSSKIVEKLTELHPNPDWNQLWHELREEYARGNYTLLL